MIQQKIMQKKVDAGGGWPAIFYTFRMGRRVGLWRLLKAMGTKNSCKTCALGMGGQKGGMRNELGRWPELCKKSLQAMVADMQGALSHDFFKTYSISQMRTLSSRELEAAGRICHPMFLAKGTNHFVPLTWEKALALVADRLKSTTPDKTFWYFSGRSSNEAGFLLQLLARDYGTNNINNCSYYCHQASGVGLGGAIGSGTATIRADEIEKTELLFLIGGNPASNHPRFMTHLMHLKRRGGKVIVVNPVKETGLVKFRVPSHVRSLLFGTKIADEYLQVKVGGDIALLAGIAKVVLEQGKESKDFIEGSTNDFDAFKVLVSGLTWDDIVERSGIERTRIEEIAALYIEAKSCVFSWTMGITHHLHGVENVQWIVNLALLRGMVGTPNSGLLPLRGHSNVQGIGTVGVVPTLKPEMASRFKLHGLSYPEAKGMDTMECMDAAQNDQIDVGISLGGNLFASNPDAKFAESSLRKVGLMVYLNTTLNTGHAVGTGQDTLILPVQARDEEPYSSTQESMFNYMRLSDGGAPRYEGPRSEVSIIAALGESLIGSSTLDWSSMHDVEAIRGLLSKVVPGLEQSASIGKTKKEYYIPGRHFTEPRFPTVNGRANFHAHPIPKSSVGEGELMLISARSEGQFNTVVYEEEDLYRGQERRDIVLMNPKDMETLGICENDPLEVTSQCGTMSGYLARPYDIKEGAALMYYPESNVLVNRAVDGQSKTPAFKGTPIKIRKCEPGLVVSSNSAQGASRPRAGGLGHFLRRKFRPQMKTC